MKRSQPADRVKITTITRILKFEAIQDDSGKGKSQPPGRVGIDTKRRNLKVETIQGDIGKGDNPKLQPVSKSAPEGEF